MKQPLMQTKIISRILLGLGLMFVLVSAITQVHGDSPASPTMLRLSLSVALGMSRGGKPVHCPGYAASAPFGGCWVNFSVSGTAVPGVDYVPVVSPTYVDLRLRSNPGPNLT